MSKSTLAWRSWLSAARPKTLTAAVVPVVGATALVAALGHEVQYWISGLALLASLLIQTGTNFVNDAIDFKKGADTETRIGPRRVTASGVFSYKQVMGAAALSFSLALLCGVPLVIHGGMPILLIGMLSVLMGYGYTGGPFPLAYLGLGDIFVILFFGWIAVGGLFFLHTGVWSWETLVLGLQVGFHCTVLIAVNNLRDMAQDALVPKRTLPVRWGKSFARFEIAFLSLTPFLLSLFWWIRGFSWAMVLPLLVLPLAIRLTILVYKTEPSPLYNRFLGQAAALHLIFGILTSLGLVL